MLCDVAVSVSVPCDVAVSVSVPCDVAVFLSLQQLPLPVAAASTQRRLLGEDGHRYHGPGGRSRLRLRQRHRLQRSVHGQAVRSVHGQAVHATTVIILSGFVLVVLFLFFVSTRVIIAAGSSL